MIRYVHHVLLYFMTCYYIYMKTKLYLDSIFIQFVNKRERSQSKEFPYLFIYYLFTAIGN